MSRLRGTTKDGPKLNYGKDHYHEDEEPKYKIGSRENRYHFGMVRHEEIKNGRDKEETEEDPDVLYKRSREHFGAWDIKDIVHEENTRSRKIERIDDTRVTNGKLKIDEGSLDRETGSHRSRRKENRESPDPKCMKSRSRNNDSRVDERDLLLREIENLAVDGRSPDRRIRAMIERFKSREEEKLKSKSPEREERSRSGTRNDRVDHVIDDRVDRNRIHEDREDERRSARSKIPDPENFDRDTAREGARSMDRRSRSSEKFHESPFSDKDDDCRRSESFRQKSDEKNSRRKSREIDDDRSRSRDSPKRRSYAYESPEDFDVRIQRYERAIVEPRKDPDLLRKESFKDHDRPVSRKSSFKVTDSKKNHTSRDSSLGRKTSFKDQDADVFRKNSVKNQPEVRYFGKDQEIESRKTTPKEQQNDYGKITLKNRDDEIERKNSVKGQTVSRISFKDDGELTRINSYKEKDRGDLGRKNSFKEKTVEFGGISYKDPDEDTEPIYKDQDNELGKVSFKTFDESDRTHSPNGRYEFGKVAFKNQDDARSPTRDQDHDPERRSSYKDRDPSRRRNSLRSKLEKKSERHSRPLSPPRHGSKDQEDQEFCSKSWQESNRTFAVKYLRENSKIRANPEGRADIDLEDSQDLQIATSEDLKDTEGRTYNDNNKYTSQRNGATIIRIRSSPENPVERRRRRRPDARRRRYEEEEDDTEDEDERLRTRRDTRSVPTPSRRIWNYREGGVLITDVEEGQPCLECGETCPGFSPHSWRKNCTSCKCPREVHDVCHEEWVSVRSRLGLKGEESSQPIGFEPRKMGLAWAPPGLPAHKVEEYFSMLPESSVPRLCTAGERHRDRQLAFQLPKQDLARAYCRHLNPQHAGSADDFMAARNEIALDIGSVQEVLERDDECGACQAPLKYGSLAVSASKLSLLYHPTCFRCTECKELLVDLAYCVHDDTLFCERHYAEQLKPRCAACDELIFSGEYTKAMNKDWHSGHFCCWQCDESLTGQRYVLRDEHPYCIKCYEGVFANGCEECNKIIGIDSKDLSYKDKHWHEACFLCNRCRVSLVDKQFGSKVDKIYCGNCYDAQFASRCDGCGEIFRAGTKKMEYKTRQWHEKCFCCVVCKNPIGTKSFIPREQEIYCAGCYEDKFATRCVKCNKIITSGGVTYKNEPWHRDCFTCSNCNNSLAGQRFTSRDDKPYCADCFGELFAKRCTACSKPITGIGGTRFISFEDRHWHNDCFICAGCKTSLVGRGFITDGEDIICPECAKMKLM